MLRTLQSDSRWRALPVIVVSAESRPQRIDECFDAGATQFLTKPLDGAQLLRAIDDALKALVKASDGIAAEVDIALVLRAAAERRRAMRSSMVCANALDEGQLGEEHLSGCRQHVGHQFPLGVRFVHTLSDRVRCVTRFRSRRADR